MQFPSGMLLLLITLVCVCWKWFVAAEIITTGTHFRDITTESSRSSTLASKDENFSLQEEMLQCSRENECKKLGSRTGTEKLSAIGKGGNLSEYDEIFEKKETGWTNVIMALCDKNNGIYLLSGDFSESDTEIHHDSFIRLLVKRFPSQRKLINNYRILNIQIIVCEYANFQFFSMQFGKKRNRKRILSFDIRKFVTKSI